MISLQDAVSYGTASCKLCKALCFWLRLSII
jgi:hypothetical protein